MLLNRWLDVRMAVVSPRIYLYNSVIALLGSEPFCFWQDRRGEGGGRKLPSHCTRNVNVETTAKLCPFNADGHSVLWSFGASHTMSISFSLHSPRTHVSVLVFFL